MLQLKRLQRILRKISYSSPASSEVSYFHLYPTTLVISQVFIGSIFLTAGWLDPLGGRITYPTFLFFIEALQLLISIILMCCGRNHAPLPYNTHESDVSLPLRETNNGQAYSDNETLPIQAPLSLSPRASSWSLTPIAFLTILHGISHYFAASYFNMETLQNAPIYASFAPLFTAVQSYLLHSHHRSHTLWHSLLLQLAGIILIVTSIYGASQISFSSSEGDNSPMNVHFRALLQVSLTSLLAVASEKYYKSQAPESPGDSGDPSSHINGIWTQNMRLFSARTVFYGVIALLEHLFFIPYSSASNLRSRDAPSFWDKLHGGRLWVEKDIGWNPKYVDWSRQDGYAFASIILGRAIMGVAASGVLKYGSALSLSVTQAFSATLLAGLSMFFRLMAGRAVLLSSGSLSASCVLGVGISLYGAYIYRISLNSNDLPAQDLELPRQANGWRQTDHHPSGRLKSWRPVVLASALTIIILAIIQGHFPSTLGDTGFQPLIVAADMSLPLSLFRMWQSESQPIQRQCTRQKLLSHQWYAERHSTGGSSNDSHSRSNSKSTHSGMSKGPFDDVLLIVFFSHARYDVNLDSYRESYGDYFPNIVFIGPGSREDAGFQHSYDVLVDSYKSDEDLSDPDWFKMAGRMAHHMLYTAMAQYDCYDGYLWAPFDTLLNIPRLIQFPLDKIWYHSPFAEYLPNVALKNSSMHPPPAIISPDPFGDYAKTWRGWASPDWWWGDPHVGLGVCMSAFELVPLARRERLATMTKGETRLIGGSCDTLYVPSRLRKDLLETLGLFLETDCFLEIALPTTVHLILPPAEKMVFVDHWWIWQPPFNSTFVRQKWEEGYEVDTFHTFHWGDQQQDGVWRGNPGNVPDLRALQEESAGRQGVSLVRL